MSSEFTVRFFHQLHYCFSNRKSSAISVFYIYIYFSVENLLHSSVTKVVFHQKVFLDEL